MLQRVIFHLVERRGHLLLDCLPRGVYFLAEATRDLEAFLEQNPLYAPPHEGAVGSSWRTCGVLFQESVPDHALCGANGRVARVKKRSRGILFFYGDLFTQLAHSTFLAPSTFAWGSLFEATFLSCDALSFPLVFPRRSERFPRKAYIRERVVIQEK